MKVKGQELKAYLNKVAMIVASDELLLKKKIAQTTPAPFIQCENAYAETVSYLFGTNDRSVEFAGIRISMDEDRISACREAKGRIKLLDEGFEIKPFDKNIFVFKGKRSRFLITQKQSFHIDSVDNYLQTKISTISYDSVILLHENLPNMEKIISMDGSLFCLTLKEGYPYLYKADGFPYSLSPAVMKEYYQTAEEFQDIIEYGLSEPTLRMMVYKIGKVHELEQFLHQNWKEILEQVKIGVPELQSKIEELSDTMTYPLWNFRFVSTKDFEDPIHRFNDGWLHFATSDNVQKDERVLEYMMLQFEKKSDKKLSDKQKETMKVILLDSVLKDLRFYFSEDGNFCIHFPQELSKWKKAERSKFLKYVKYYMKLLYLQKTDPTFVIAFA